MASQTEVGVFDALRRDYGDQIFKYLTCRDFGRLESAFPRELVFLTARDVRYGGEALLRTVAGRRHAEAVEAGATVVPLGEGRGAHRRTWATELRLVYMAMMRARVRGRKFMISAAENHSLVTSGNEGEVWSFGYGSYGKLGHGAVGAHFGTGNEVVPRLIEAFRRVKVRQVEAGQYHSMALSERGRTFTWGYGGRGQLGHNNSDSQNVPKHVDGLPAVKAIAAGYQHSLAVGEDGSLFTWGNNGDGRLGLVDFDQERNVPTMVPGMRNVLAVAAGSAHTLALNSDGTVMACGKNRNGELGLGDTEEDRCLQPSKTFTVVPDLIGVVDIDAGDKHSIAVTCEGDVYTWGMGGPNPGVDGGPNPMCPCGSTQKWKRCCKSVSRPTKVNRVAGGLSEAVVQAVAGYGHSMVLTTTGELFTWGKGAGGQLGHGGIEDLCSVPTVVDGIGAVLSMAGGRRHSLVTTREGRVFVFGTRGLGLGAAVSEAFTPTAIDGIALSVGADAGLADKAMEASKEGKEGKEGKERSE